MASTYENDLRLEEMATGENSGSWGTKTNNNLELVADAFSYGTEIIANADTAITIADGVADAARSLALKITSSEDLTTTRVITLGPSTVSKVWIIENSTSGGQTLTISAGSGSNITLANGKTKIIATDGIGAGSNVVELTQDIAIADLFVDDDLTVGDDIIMDSDGGILKIGADADLQVTHSGSAGTITNATGDLTLDVAGDIILDADDGDIQFKNGGTLFGSINSDASSPQAMRIQAHATDGDIIFKGSDGGSTITALTLDMSQAGEADFNSAIKVSNQIVAHQTNKGVLEYNSNITRLRSYGASAGTGELRFQTGGGGGGADSLAMTIDSSQRILIGGASSVPMGDTNHQVQLQGDNFAKTSNVIQRYGDSTAGGMFAFAKSRNATIGSQTIVQDDDQLGKIRWYGSNGSNFTYYAAEISASVEGTPSTSADMPGRLVFSTTSDGAGSPTERMRINNAGTVIINPNLTGGYTPLIIKGERSSSTTLLSLETDGTGQVDDTINLDFKMNSGADAAERVAGRIGVQNVTTGAARGRMIFSVLEDAGNLIEAMRIDDDGEVLIGSTTTGGSITPMNLKLTTEGNSGNNLVIGKHVAGAYAPAIAFAASEGTEASPTVVAVDDPLGQINFYGYDGDSYGLGAYIRASVDGTPSTSTDMPTRVSIFTALDGTESPVERMRISSNGFVNIGGARTADESLVELNKSGSNTVGEGHIGFAGGADPLFAIRFDNSDFNFRLDRSYGGWTSTSALSVRRSNGYVGLGVDTASYPLDVQNSASTYSRVLATGNNTRAAFLAQAHLSDGTDINMNVGVYGDANQGEISMSTGHPLLLYTNNDPNKGIEIQVDGDLNIKDGNLVVASGHGIDFSAADHVSGKTSELLDDYEEGTWRPTMTSGSTNVTLEHQDTVQGVYTKIGRLVTLHMEVDISNLNGGTGIINITGLPFTVSNNLAPTGIEASGSVSYFAGWSNNVINVGIFAGSDTKLQLQKLLAAATNPTDVNGNDIGTGEFRATITYFSG
jgi:hypothetical protein